MGDGSLDRVLAAAESRLDRIDDGPERDTQDSSIRGDVDLSSDGLHIEVEEPTAGDDEDPDGPGPVGELVDCIDAFNEAFNARDLDGLLDVMRTDCEAPGLGNDMDNLPDAVEDLWDRRPTCLLTRGELDDQPLSVVWEMSDDGWWCVAVMFFADPNDGQLGVVEYGEDPDALERVRADAPDGDVDEGTRWREWEEGSDGD